MFFKQLKYRGDNFTYIIADENSKEAAIVDPSFNIDAILLLLKDKDYRAKYVINTHDHGDHTSGNEDLKSHFGAGIVAHEHSRTRKDTTVTDGDTIKFGRISIRVIYTPGHSPDSICLLLDSKLLTGDTLFIGECGRTDISGGDPEEMYHSLNRLKEMDDAIEVYPGHDYGAKPSSTIGEEKKTNYTLEKRSLREFIQFMQQP